VSARDEYFEAVFAESARHSIVAGAGFWAWSGEGRPREPGGYWRKGDPILGDPAHEPQGWYGVYSSDLSTLGVLKAAARAFSRTKN
jgi:mannan endo-1,4-beta-mannosidase